MPPLPPLSVQDIEGNAAVRDEAGVVLSSTEEEEEEESTLLLL
jgi:hypothetical protein